MVKLTGRLMLLMVGTAAYAGLAVLGWGGFGSFFSHPPLIALTAVLFILAGASLPAGGNMSPGVREDQFDGQYVGYCARTWRLIPWLY